MKKIIGMIVAIGVLTTSCGDDFLSKFPNTQVSEGNFYKTEDQLSTAVNDCYRQLNRLYEESSICELYGELYSDNTWMQYFASSDPFLDNISKYIQEDNNGYILDAWNNCYNGIYICNNVLYWLENSEAVYKNEQTKNQFMGEVLTIRALFYFNMVRAWGAIPMPLMPVSPEESYAYLREDPSKVYEQIIKDLTIAKEGLPGSYPKAQVGKITKYAVMALLGKVYLTLGDKAKAAVELKAVIDCGQYSLDANEDGGINGTDYEHLFAPATKNCKESLLECQFLAGVSNPNGTHQTAYTPFYWSFHLPGQTETFRGHGHCTPTKDLIAEFEPTDTIRKNITVVEGYVDLESGKWEDYPFTMKFYDPNWRNPGNNFKILRYADVLLMYAEAVGENAGKVYLNQVRSRAGLPGYGEVGYPKEYGTFDLALEHERRVELAMEFHRFFDLVRTNRAIEVINSKGFNLTAERLLFPIPVTEIDINPGLSQNPGY